MMRSVLLSHFDTHLGPTITLSIPAMSQDELRGFNVIPKLLDITDDEGFFISTLNMVYSANYYFSIENENARGGKDLLLVSIAVQMSQDDNKEKVLLFLKNEEASLRRYAHRLANEDVNEVGLLSPENRTALKDSLHGLFTTVFQERHFEANVKRGGDRIVVFAHAGFDPMRVIDYYREELRKDERPSLRTRLVTSAIDELSYNPFHCNDRGSDTCMKDECPVCKELLLESDAAIYMYDSGSFKPDADFDDMVDYLGAIDHAKRIPVLIMQVDGDSSVDRGVVYEEVTARLQGAMSKGGFKIGPRHGRVPFGNVEAFKDCMSWLIKAII
ncbi:MAG: hypothetical protein JW839_00135 [Candidatus Lokiarchaeota archaeon]|nr:hypothetical protein [Candidatus Lokiarchaeota archaeon]